MFNKKMKQLTVAAVSASMIFSSAAAAAGSASDDGGVSLSIAGGEETEDEESIQEEDTEAQETEETESETQTETEEAVSYDQLETTATDESAINAIDVSEIVANTMPSIVAVTGTSVQEVESYFYGTQEIETEGAGSGIIIAQNDTELLIATNNHVVEDTTQLSVCFSVDADDADKLVAPAVIKGTDSENDLAVIAVNLSDIDPEVFSQLKIATLGSSDDLAVGETTIVIGNALGIGQTVTTGIVSALQREIQTEQGTFTEVQTDAAVNLGCSGGAMLNARGEVIAITDAKATSDYAESMGYGIPIDTAIPILEELINRETRTTVEEHGYLGITVVPVSDEAVSMYGMPSGAYVYSVNEGEAAEAAGIQKGDIITKFDGISISSSDDLVNTLGYYEAGETVTVELQRADGSEYSAVEVEVILQEGTSDTASDTDDADTDDADSNDDQNNDSQSQDPSDTDSPDSSSDQGNVQQMPGGGGFGFMPFGDGSGSLW